MPRIPKGSLVAVTRDVSPGLANCQLTHLSRQTIDYHRACQQHQQYTQTLRDLGCTVLTVPTTPDLPDSVFVEDTAVVFDEVTILTRPGALSRQPEVSAMAEALAPYRAQRAIEAPGTLDGGDVLKIGRRVYVGESLRSNAEGVRQLAHHLSPFHYTVETVPMVDCLHLKTAVTAISEDTLLIQSNWIEGSPFGDWRTLEVDPEEPFSANAFPVGGTIIYPEAFPRTRKILQNAGFEVRTVPADELAKAEGGVTCCSLIFSA